MDDMVNGGRNKLLDSHFNDDEPAAVDPSNSSMQRSFLKPSTIIAFLAGVGLSASVVAVHSCATASTKGIGQWGAPQVFFGDEARQHILNFGLKIPSGAQTPYYYVDGFPDHTRFISFTANPEIADSVVREYAKVGFSEFEPWSNQIASNLGGIREPGIYGPRYETPYYDLDALKDAVVYIAKTTSGHGFHFIYDRATQRLYFCAWDT